MIQHALHCDQVKHLEISGDLVKSPDGWRPGRFRFSWTHPLQLGTVVTSSKLHGDFCVVADSGGAVKIRSTNPRHPYVMYADTYGLQLSSTTTVGRSLNSPCHTLRSSPDEPGNCVWLDHRFCPPMLRRMHSHEVWAMQGRCQSKLRKMVELGYSDSQIVHKAGKAITGKMAAFMADARALRVPQLRAAAAGCLSPLAEDFSSLAFYVPIMARTKRALVAAGGLLLPGSAVNTSRESALTKCQSFVRSTFGADYPVYLAGQAVPGDTHRWIYACPLPETATLTSKSPAGLEWLSFKELTQRLH